MSTTMHDPAAVEERLTMIEADLAVLANELEDAALTWFRAKRDREREHAVTFIQTEGTAGERKAAADRAVADMQIDLDGYSLSVWEAEGRYEGLKAKARVLDTRAAIGMSILRAQTRGGGA